MKTIVTINQPGGNIYVKKADDSALCFPYSVYFDDDNQFAPKEELHDCYKTLPEAMKAISEMIIANVGTGLYDED